MRSAEGFVVLKSFLLIFSDLIFDSKVDPGRPSLAAAPDGPDTCPPLSRRAASIISFSWAASFRDSSSWLSARLQEAAAKANSHPLRNSLFRIQLPARQSTDKADHWLKSPQNPLNTHRRHQDSGTKNLPLILARGTHDILLCQIEAKDLRQTNSFQH